MGNSLGGRKTCKVMKINGETFKLKTPVKAGEVVKGHPGHVLLESEAVKHYGIRAKPLEPQQDLVPKRLYFLVELPQNPTKKDPRRVRSGIHMSAKDRLESLMLARRSASDLSIMKPTTSSSILPEEPVASANDRSSTTGNAMRVKMRLPKAQVERLMQESKDEAEVASRIVDLCLKNTAGNSNYAPVAAAAEEGIVPLNLKQETHWKSSGHGGGREDPVVKAREKRVSFLPISEGEMQIAVASY